MYCKENRELLHKYYAEIAMERMFPMTIIFLKDTRLFCLHLNMKRILNQKLMLEWMWRKCSEEQGNVLGYYM
jgi:hypothetical protein